MSSDMYGPDPQRRSMQIHSGSRLLMFERAVFFVICSWLVDNVRQYLPLDFFVVQSFGLGSAMVIEL